MSRKTAVNRSSSGDRDIVRAVFQTRCNSDLVVKDNGSYVMAWHGALLEPQVLRGASFPTLCATQYFPDGLAPPPVIETRMTPSPAPPFRRAGHLNLAGAFT